MSQENLKAFYHKFRVDDSLQTELEGITNAREYAEKAVSLGADRGFDFSTTEVEAALQNPSIFLEETLNGELNDLEMEIVAGGHDPLERERGDWGKINNA